MEINEKDLQITHLFRVKLIDKTEKFYILPFADGYALSNYGRLYYTCIGADGQEHTLKQKIIEDDGEEAYLITVNGKDKQPMKIRHIISRLLFGNENYIIYHRKKQDDPKRWSFNDLIILNGENKKLEIKNSIKCGDKSIYMEIYSKYWNMYTRCTNEHFKNDINPLYKDARLCDEWLNDYNAFQEWYLQNMYLYPGILNLDKDLLSYGIGKMYSPEFACILPAKYNTIFKRSYSKLGFLIQKKEIADGSPYYYLSGHAYKLNGKAQRQFGSPKYSEVLKVARKRKAKYIRYLVKAERKAGFMPEHLLKAMERWADLCEVGLSIWEPDNEKLIEEGII